MDEFTLTRHGEPFLFILGPFGATWMREELLFDRPIEKLGSKLAILQNEKLLTDDPILVTRVAAHWKKQLKRRLKKLQETKPTATLADVIGTGPYEEVPRE